MTFALLEIGRVARPHALAGEVVVDLWTNRTERLQPGAVLKTVSRDLEVLSSRHQRGDRWIVSFAGVTTAQEAEQLRGEVLLAEPLEDKTVLWVHELIGLEVVEVAGRALGTVSAVEANPASDLLVLDSGALVPLRFVVEGEPSVPGRITVDIPPGLVELD
ncbi:MAG: ribosome maturation factor RimM [Actinobacteria bacterium]|nr:ribosome maturation factor RimM [Actinomycetota bacterium]